jgi:hypothetical protein
MVSGLGCRILNGLQANVIPRVIALRLGFIATRWLSGLAILSVGPSLWPRRETAERAFSLSRSLSMVDLGNAHSKELICTKTVQMRLCFESIDFKGP